MNRFSRIRHHVDMKDVRRKHLEEAAAKKIEEAKIEEERRLHKEVYNKWKSDWRDELKEKIILTDTSENNSKEWSQELDDMWKSDWRDKLEEGMTPSDTFSYSVTGKGDVDLSITGTGYTIKELVKDKSQLDVRYYWDIISNQLRKFQLDEWVKKKVPLSIIDKKQKSLMDWI